MTLIPVFKHPLFFQSNYQKYGSFAAIFLFPFVTLHSPVLAEECRQDQIEMAFSNSEGPYNGMSQDKATLFFKNISDQDCSIPATPKIQFLNNNKDVLSIHHEQPETYPFRSFLHKKPSQTYFLQKKAQKEKSEAYSVLFWISAPVYATGVCLHPAFLEISFPKMHWITPFKGTFCGVTQTPWYQESPLKACTNNEKRYLSVLTNEPEDPDSLRLEGELPIEASSQGQSEPPTP
ncbi:hypothetical protein FAI40_07815 [Acetobacteraceae bacterium]|nr:hypothetical protein FAI40_07815 [Acetobacteraceae bacterium]